MVIRDHPDSRWVDDAIFLMGKALIRQGEYNKGIRKFTELVTNYPESDYVPESVYWLAYANAERKEYNEALNHVDHFLESYPEHELRYEVMFLSGDVNLALENIDEALACYSGVAEEADDQQIVDQAILKAAELYYSREEWGEAASAYGLLLRKGMSKEDRYNISIALGECYSRVNRCEEAMKLFNELLEEVTVVKDKPKPLLGRAGSYVCMDSLDAALEVYQVITKQFPRSEYAAEAYYRMAVIYHEQLDSLQRAQESYEKVGRESASSPFAAIALQKSNSLKRLIELGERGSGEETREQAAEKRFLAAEIQLTRLDEVELAIENYSAVLDSFSDTEVAPKASYALAWIYHRKLDDRERAIEFYRGTVTGYPLSLQATGAVEMLGTLGETELQVAMQAYIDSALAVAAAAQEVVRDSVLEETTYPLAPGAPPDSLADSLRAMPGFEPAPARPDTMIDSMTVAPPIPADSALTPVREPKDTTAAEPSAPADTTTTERAESADTTSLRPTGKVPADTSKASSRPSPADSTRGGEGD
jgi:TolA-binding protein